MQEEGIEVARRQLSESTPKTVPFKPTEATIYRVETLPTSLPNKIKMTYEYLAEAEVSDGGIQLNLAADACKKKTISHTAAYTATREEFNAIAAGFGKGLEANYLPG